MTHIDSKVDINLIRLTWNQKDLFYKLINAGMLEWNAFTSCLSIE